MYLSSLHFLNRISHKKEMCTIKLPHFSSQKRTSNYSRLKENNYLSNTIRKNYHTLKKFKLSHVSFLNYYIIIFFLDLLHYQFFFYNYYIINWIWINTQKHLIEKWILFSWKKKILYIFSNCDERKIIILNNKKKKASSHARSACDEASIYRLDIFF